MGEERYAANRNEQKGGMEMKMGPAGPPGRVTLGWKSHYKAPGAASAF